MVTIEQVVGIALASVVLIAVPGPSVMLVVGQALSHGRGNALASVVGNTAGCNLAGLAITVGLGPLLERSELISRRSRGWASPTCSASACRRSATPGR